jgi:hypothetical protein
MMLSRAPKQPIETTICEAHGLYVKQIVVPRAQTLIPQHAHALSHVTLVTNGAVLLWKDSKFEGRYDAPVPIFIAAGAKHLFQTLVDDTVLYCVHELTSPDALRVLAEHQIL